MVKKNLVTTFCKNNDIQNLILDKTEKLVHETNFLVKKKIYFYIYIQNYFIVKAHFIKI